MLTLTFSAPTTLNSVTFEWLAPTETLEIVLPDNSVTPVTGVVAPFTKLQAISYSFNPGDALVIRGVNGGSVNAGYVSNLNLSVDVVPEPSSALLGGLGVLALLRRRRNG